MEKSTPIISAIVKCFTQNNHEIEAIVVDKIRTFNANKDWVVNPTGYFVMEKNGKTHSLPSEKITKILSFNNDIESYLQKE